MKFGGTSVATPALIQNAAHRISERQNAGVHVVCVVSAMGYTTDQLLSLAREISERPPSRELDVLLSAGEVQSMALLSMALHEKGIAARSFTGSQGGIRNTLKQKFCTLILTASFQLLLEMKSSSSLDSRGTMNEMKSRLSDVVDPIPVR